MYSVKNTDRLRVFNSPCYNFVFDKRTGFFARCGANEHDDPAYSPFGPELADIEISSAAPEDIERARHHDAVFVVDDGGCNGLGCRKFCYKGSFGNSTAHMKLSTITRILDMLPDTVCQIAYGVCSVTSHPDIWRIFEETRKRSLVPNVTINGIGVTDEVAERLSTLCGAVAVSVNPYNRDIAYDTIHKLSQTYGMKQVNIHIVLAEDTVSFIKSVVGDMKNDVRLSNMNALVMLSFKDKANTGCYKPVSATSYKSVVEFCEQNGVTFGFDSCSAHAYMNAVKDRPNFAQLARHCEPCESGLFSIYVNTFGELFACSFCEGIGEWQDGIPLLSCNSFDEVWKSLRVEEWRVKLLTNERRCPYYSIG